MVQTEVTSSLYNMLDQFIAFIPTLVAIILLIIIGTVLGKALGRIGATVLDKIGLDDLVDRTIVGGMLRRGQMSTVGFFDAVIRWFVYIVFAIIILDLLNIEVVNNFVDLIIYYVPLVISALIVLLIGLLIVDFICDLLQKVLISTGIEEKFEQTTIGASVRSGGMTISGIIAGIVRIFGYLIFLTAASDIPQLTMITDLLIDITQYLPRVIVAIIILMVGPVHRYSHGLPERCCQRHGSGRWDVILLTQRLPAPHSGSGRPDTMMIDTGILYVFFAACMGIAIVVAFKYGVKDAIVAYAKERK